MLPIRSNVCATYGMRRELTILCYWNRGTTGTRGSQIFQHSPRGPARGNADLADVIRQVHDAFGTAIAYSYFDDQTDHRLQTIHHKYPNASTLSKFDYTYDGIGNILTWRQQADSTAVQWKYGYDPADQLTSAVKHATDTNETILQRFAYAYDPAGNRTVEQIDDAITLSAYDNLNRLTS